MRYKIFSLLFLLFLSHSLLADQKIEIKTIEPPPLPLSALKNPRQTIATYLHAMNDFKRGQTKQIEKAIATFDLSEVNGLVRQERGKNLAWMLLDILDRSKIIQLSTITDRQQGLPYVLETYKNGEIRLARQEDGRWLFDIDTIRLIPLILEEVSDKKRLTIEKDKGNKQSRPFYLRIREQLPAGLRHKTLVLENWQWFGVFIFVVLGVLADFIMSLVFKLLLRYWKSKKFMYRHLSDDSLRPFGLMAMALIWLVGIRLMGFSEQIMLILLIAVKFLVALSTVWTVYRLVDLVAIWVLEKAHSTENKLDDMLAPLVPKTLKIFVTIMGIIFVAENLNINISSLLAGLGIGGLAFALAAKDMVQNIFGSITVLLDQTFTAGDWIKVGDVEGSVEQIGFRSTKVRTFYNSLITMPNSVFITAEVDNMGERRYRRYSTRFSLTYDTPPDKIEAFCEGIREIVRLHPYMRKDYYHVYLNDFSATSLDVLVYVFWETPDWSTELRERHRFLLDCLRLAQNLGVEYAFPTQTLHLKKAKEGVDLTEQLSETDAHQKGAESARKIVEATGKGKKEPPVIF